MSPLLARPSLRGIDIVWRSLLLLLAIVLASAPLSLLLAGPSWITLTAVGAVPVIVAGMILRQLVRVPLLVPVLQGFVVALLVLVMEFEQGLVGLDQGLRGILGAQFEIFPAAVLELGSGFAPMVIGARGSVIVVLMIALAALALDLLFIDLGWHTPTGLALMGTVLVPALQEPGGGAWWTIAGPVLAGLLILSTRTVHGDPSYVEGEHRPQAAPLPRAWRTATVVVIAAVVVALGSAPLAPRLPAVAESRVALDMDVVNQWQNRETPQLGPVMVDDDVSVRRSLLSRDDTEVLRYATTADRPSYLRLRTLNAFDGESFVSGGEDSPGTLEAEPFSDARTDGVSRAGGRGEMLEHELEVMSLGGDRLPVPDNIRSLDIDVDDPDALIALDSTAGEATLRRSDGGLTGVTYTVQSEENPATADELRAVPASELGEPFEAGYISRDEVPEVAQNLAEEVASQAGAENGFDAAVAYQNYFRSSFSYSLTVQTPPGEDPVESFLADRVGYCEQFAAVFALMMTSQGYPSRVAIGFTAGRPDGGEWSVASSNAHAWPEVWFGPDHGWIAFEPTPAAAANGIREPAVTSDDTEDEVPEPVPDDPTAADPEPEEDEQGTEEEPAEDESEEDTGEQSDPSTSEAQEEDERAGVSPLLRGVLSALGAGAVLFAGAAVLPAVLQRRRIRRREARWAALLGERDDGAATSSGAAEPAPGGVSGTEGTRREAGMLAWSDLEDELRARRLATTWLGWTGGWGRPPRSLELDATLPAPRALDALLDRIEEGSAVVSPEHRAAAARIAAALTAARYAPPVGAPEPAGAGERGGVGERGGASQRSGASERTGERERTGAGERSGASERTGERDRTGAGERTGERDRTGAGERAADDQGAGAVTPERIRQDADLLTMLIRTAR